MSRAKLAEPGRIDAFALKDGETRQAPGGPDPRSAMLLSKPSTRIIAPPIYWRKLSGHRASLLELSTHLAVSKLNLVDVGPKLVESRPNSVDTWPKLADVGPTEQGQLLRTLRQVWSARSARLRPSLGDLGRLRHDLGKHRPSQQ